MESPIGALLIRVQVSHFSAISLPNRVYALCYLNLPLYTWPFCTWHVLTTDRTVSAVRIFVTFPLFAVKGGSYNHDRVPKITWKWEPRDAHIYGVCIFSWHRTRSAVNKQSKCTPFRNATVTGFKDGENYNSTATHRVSLSCQRKATERVQKCDLIARSTARAAQSHITTPTGSNQMPVTDTSVFWTRNSGPFHCSRKFLLQTTI